MNKLLVYAVSRYLANTVVVALLAAGYISAGDKASWTDTFYQLFLGLVSVGILVWTIAQNKWPSLVKLTVSMPEVSKILLTPSAASLDPKLTEHPDVGVNFDARHNK